jgi:hypothetical protein
MKYTAIPHTSHLINGYLRLLHLRVTKYWPATAWYGRLAMVVWFSLLGQCSAKQLHFGQLRAVLNGCVIGVDCAVF